MATLKRHAKRGNDKNLFIGQAYTSAFWHKEPEIFLRLSSEDGLCYSVILTPAEAAEIGKHFCDYAERAKLKQNADASIHV